jgi:hypothetical protein
MSTCGCAISNSDLSGSAVTGAIADVLTGLLSDAVERVRFEQELEGHLSDGRCFVANAGDGFGARDAGVADVASLAWMGADIAKGENPKGDVVLGRTCCTRACVIFGCPLEPEAGGRRGRAPASARLARHVLIRRDLRTDYDPLVRHRPRSCPGTVTPPGSV